MNQFAGCSEIGTTVARPLPTPEQPRSSAPNGQADTLLPSVAGDIGLPRSRRPACPKSADAGIGAVVQSIAQTLLTSGGFEPTWSERNDEEATQLPTMFQALGAPGHPLIALGGR